MTWSTYLVCLCAMLALAALGPLFAWLARAVWSLLGLLFSAGCLLVLVWVSWLALAWLF